MSRTFRFIPFWARSISHWDKTRQGLYLLGYCETPGYKEDKRSALFNGYDSGKGRSGLYANFTGPCWREEYTGKTRKFVKRRYHRQGRAFYRKLDQEDWCE